MLPKSTLELIERVKTDFVGLDTSYTLADGRTTRRIYLDSTASTLMMGAAQRAMLKFLGHYANTHSLQHFPAKVATREYAWRTSASCPSWAPTPTLTRAFLPGPERRPGSTGWRVRSTTIVRIIRWCWFR